MNRKKLLCENFLVYGLGGMISQVIPFVMLPIITYLLPNESYYGINDLVQTVATLCCEIGMLGMWDAAFRFFFDSEDLKYRKDVCSTSMFVAMCATFISVMGLCSFKDVIISRVYGDSKYSFLLLFNVLMIFFGNIKTVLSAPTRMQNKRKVFLFVNTIAPLITYAIAIVLIINHYYLSALPLAAIVSSGSMCIIFGRLNRRWFSFRNIRMDLIKPLILFGIPIFAQKIMYYIINSSDKLMIATFLGQNANGIYAVGARFGSVSQIIYSAFAGGWVYYRYATMKAEDQVENTSKIFEVLSIVSFMAFIMACLFARVIIEFLFKKDYHAAYIVIPYLFFAPLVQMIFQVVAGQFSVIKKTWPNLIFLTMGAITNIILNYFLIPCLGIEGASIATLVGYVITAVVATIVCLKIKMIFIRRRYCISLFLVISYYFVWRFNVDVILIPILYAIFVFGVFFFMYKFDLMQLLGIGKGKSGKE